MRRFTRHSEYIIHAQWIYNSEITTVFHEFSRFTLFTRITRAQPCFIASEHDILCITPASGGKRLTLLLHVKYKISFMVFQQRNLVKFTVLQYQGIKFPLKSGFSWFSVPFHSILCPQTMKIMTKILVSLTSKMPRYLPDLFPHFCPAYCKKCW